MLPESEILIRMVIAAVIGLMIGYSRREKVAGLRTFALICYGCTIFTIISISDVFGPASVTDQTRILGQVVSGIGFLGLGVIWKQKTKPTGLTTAAMIWVTAAIGMLIGLGMWTEVLVGTPLTLILVYSKGILVRMGMRP